MIAPNIVEVIERGPSGRNEVFRDTVTRQEMTREEFVGKIEEKLYPGYHNRIINGIETPCSNPSFPNLLFHEPNAKIEVLRESASGRNLEFRISMNRPQLVRMIEHGMFPDYHVRTINGIKTPVSNPGIPILG